MSNRVLKNTLKLHSAQTKYCYTKMSAMDDSEANSGKRKHEMENETGEEPGKEPEKEAEEESDWIGPLPTEAVPAKKIKGTL